MAARGENVLFSPKNFDMGQKVNFLHGNSDFCQQGISPLYPGLQLSYWNHPQIDNENDNGPGLGRNYGETDVFTLGRKLVFGPKMGFNPKNHP